MMWAALLANQSGLTGHDGPVTAVAAGALALLGFWLPPGVLFFAFGIPAGLAAGQLVGQADFLLGFFPAYLGVGVLAAAFSRPISAIAASLVGAWLLVIGLLAALHPFKGLVNAVAAQPWAVISAAGLFALAGAIFQLVLQPPPELAERQRAERHRNRRKVAEKQALEERWANYSSRKKE
jgi:hypothetical protein